MHETAAQLTNTPDLSVPAGIAGLVHLEHVDHVCVFAKLAAVNGESQSLGQPFWQRCGIVRSDGGSSAVFGVEDGQVEDTAG